ncbi:hypothetical protein [Vibrio vulnificus]|uniref:hypothetical protein n=1 Tax=Vibrio vulnificus TaxID=672 RepID=UPI001D2C6EA7|nr:hypothetical protein [Vibrio vulnificus]MCG6285903.1 hypothetical protein [Vibrio vulnificus]
MSTLLFKNNRIRAKHTTRLKNLIRHLIRNYKPETRQAKEDFNLNEIHNNFIIDADFKLSKFGPNWLDGDVAEEKHLINSLIENVVSKSNEHIQTELEKADTLTVKEKKAVRKSIDYYARINPESMSDKERNALQPLIEECKTIKEQDKSNKNYYISEQAIVRAKLFFDELTPDTKVKSLNAKKNNIMKIKDGISGMQLNTNNIKNTELKPNSIIVEERLFKIPKHNKKGLTPEIMTEIMQSFHEEYFSDYDVLRGYIHLDERTSKGNEVDDHVHFIVSGYNNETKKFDITERSHNLGLKIAQKTHLKKDRSGVKIDVEEALRKPYNKATDEERTLSGEMIQEAFYRKANKILRKHNIDIKFEKKELTDEEKELRAFLASQSNLPKAERVGNMVNYMAEKSKKTAKKINDYKEKNKGLIKERNDLIIEKGKLEVEVEELQENMKTLSQRFKDFINQAWGWINNNKKESLKNAAVAYNDIEDIGDEYATQQAYEIKESIKGDDQAIDTEIEKERRKRSGLRR